jgi:hypothetical protein
MAHGGAFTTETKVIASNDNWGRYSNRAVGGGGGLLFGCRSEPGGTRQKNYPCARSRNVANGLARPGIGGRRQHRRARRERRDAPLDRHLHGDVREGGQRLRAHRDPVGNRH